MALAAWSGIAVLGLASLGVCLTRSTRARLLVEALRGIGEILADVGRAVVKVDEAPIRDRVLAEARRAAGGLVSRLRMRPSGREPGVQLADLVVGAFCRGGLEQG